LNPPTRDTIARLFHKYDLDKTNRITRQEFTALARVFARRGLTRLLTYKLMSLVAAPMLATLLAEWWKQYAGGDKDWLSWLAAKVFPERIVTNITSPTFCRTVLTVIFVKSLGNVVLGGVDYLMNRNLPPVAASDDEEEATKRRRRHGKI
jgi:hypothetical protein